MRLDEKWFNLVANGKEATEWYESFPGYKNKEVVMFYF